MKAKGIQTLPSRTFYYEGESLLSYLLRSAFNSGISVLLLLNMIRKNEKYLLHRGDIRRIDFFPESIFDLNKLTSLTGISRSDLYKGTFTNVLNAFGYGANGEKARLMKNMLRETLHYCKQCLEEGRGYNLMWKVEGVDSCLKHNQKLENHCLHCKQEICYQHIVIINRCPHCDELLTELPPDYLKNGIENITRQQSLQANLYELIQRTDLRFEAQALAQKLLYLMNGFQSVYQAATIKKSLQGYSFTYLLQYARDTISTQKNIKLSFILEVLHSQSVDINSLSIIEVPTTFIDSLLEGNSIEWTREYTCQAPWCKERGQRMSLTPTNSKHCKKAGEKLSHYLVCKECFCEYAFNEERILIERTSFISAYDVMHRYDISSMTWSEKRKCFLMNREQIRRASAYFNARQIIKRGIYPQNQSEINCVLLTKFVSALRQGKRIAEIRYWPLWEGYEHYLLHRYHPVVMSEIFNHRYVNLS
ncbi:MULTISPECIES: TniQ family protein [Paenibacillus]|uniref:TniQ protein n=1 Tax=Paenibacillus pabuli TaxID=1472 RepID=A0A855XYZ5_9BACL|nr:MULTISPECIES: TniQ family protein [Paenibacillus]PWW32920.1 TniQ protein [Paenibacillus pabuli]PXV98803.1 TniQ protein [Paenibacillus taichungensis]